MAKVTSATVRLVMKKSRANKNGEYPIHIVVCFNGRVEKSTGVSCQEKHWGYVEHGNIKGAALVWCCPD